MKLFIILSVLFIGSCSLYSQEILNDLYNNPQLEGKNPDNSLKAAHAIVSLPFFDDFSKISGYPDENLWLNKNVFVNATYGILPPSIGVATFDAVDANGFIYSSLSDVDSPADTLTSQLIDLSQADKNSTYLSFYYQPQGNGNAPEFNDSLILNFIAGNQVYEVWYANGTDFDSFKTDSLKIGKNRPDTLEFKLVMIKLDKPEYFASDFQLQFINYVSIPGKNNLSGQINCDHWNIDYVLLDENRSDADTVFDDLAMVQPPTLFLKDYSSVPWSHFQTAISKKLSNVIFSVRNNGSASKSMDQLILDITDINTGTINDFYIGQQNILPYENRSDLLWNFNNSPIEWYNADSAVFEISGEIKTKGNDQASNNFASRQVIYKNYYAYDDGTAEKAYGVDNERAKVAYRYDIMQGDSLRAVQIYFVRPKEETSAVQSYTLCVWDDYNETPGSLILKESGKKPEFSSHLNEFVTIPFDSVIYLEGTFYIGWEQSSDLLMNVGYDANTNRTGRIFYNVNSQWYPSDFNGSLMMRPVFAKHANSTGIKDKKWASAKLTISPNPSRGAVRISGEEGFNNAIINVFDYSGKKVYDGMLDSNNNIDLSFLKNGIYLVTVQTNSGWLNSGKLIIAK